MVCKEPYFLMVKFSDGTGVCVPEEEAFMETCPRSNPRCRPGNRCMVCPNGCIECQGQQLLCLPHECTACQSGYTLHLASPSDKTGTCTLRVRSFKPTCPRSAHPACSPWNQCERCAPGCAVCQSKDTNMCHDRDCLVCEHGYNLRQVDPDSGKGICVPSPLTQLKLAHATHEQQQQHGADNGEGRGVGTGAASHAGEPKMVRLTPNAGRGGQGGRNDHGGNSGGGDWLDGWNAVELEEGELEELLASKDTRERLAKWLDGVLSAMEAGEEGEEEKYRYPRDIHVDGEEEEEEEDEDGVMESLLELKAALELFRLMSLLEDDDIADYGDELSMADMDMWQLLKCIPHFVVLVVVYAIKMPLFMLMTVWSHLLSLV
ncbi:hypothetical protein PTSG_08047 [Salpingoeca rosetta]|uniref:Uncharacterized protein n=1 Tax=Salpingoeca rosetta (strain ATCC 50818 / BSB-021) TaxID=946362 RepID=F2UHU7_SALR5|nr:uncharacterized protein PTSG_08047 [Salpingoeca rosetta]EGD76696.1 hypothetical protein PTSG_08047 [Salpingoeca rosetta]|eukprot:XP_004991068.1 hypothetical protein PTSG_08047 [Salpingoeca rosetta]